MEFLMKLLEIIIPDTTPDLRSALRDMLSTLTKRAEETRNPRDEIFVEVLKRLLFPHERVK